MAAHFEKKLALICNDAFARARVILQHSITDLARVVSQVIKNRSWTDRSAKLDRAIIEALRKTLEAAGWNDAAEFVWDKVLSSPNGRIIDLPLKQDLHSVQNQIRQLFKGKKAPNRGFIYVAWRSRPEEFWYVGKAISTPRLNLARHGKLARATADVTQLSLVFPSQSYEDILLQLESSIMALVEFHTGKLPRLNQKRGPIPYGSSSTQLAQLAAFLDEIAKPMR